MKRSLALLLALVILLPGCSGTKSNESAVPQPEEAVVEVQPDEADVMEEDIPIGSYGYAAPTSDGASTYGDYCGPIMPLTLAQETPGLSATRDITFERGVPMPKPAPTQESAMRWQESAQYYIHVLDRYTLHNATDQDITVDAIYPFMSTFSNLRYTLPQTTADGNAVAAYYSVGSVMTGHRPYTAPSGAEPYSMASWEDVAWLLEDGSYMQTALGFTPGSFYTQPVTVYFFPCVIDREQLFDLPTLFIDCQKDSVNTSILCCNIFRGGIVDGPNGDDPYHIQVMREDVEAQTHRMLIVLGDDIASYTLKWWHYGEVYDIDALAGAVCTPERVEMTMEDVLKLAAESLYQSIRMEPGPHLQQLLADSYMLSHPAYCHDFEVLSTISNWECTILESNRHMFYQRFSITVPANGSVELCMDTGQVRRLTYDAGFDFMTQLGSNLPFTELRAHLVNFGDRTYNNQNMGIIPGKPDVTLDPGIPHYYLEYFEPMILS